jgi:hypothetical protein
MPADSKTLPLLIALGGLLIGTIFVLVGWWLRQDPNDLRKHGVTVKATIQKKIRKADDHSWGGLENYYLQCQFTDGQGKVRDIESKVQSKAWRLLNEGSVVSLTWLPGDLASIRYGSKSSLRIKAGAGWVIFGLGVVALVIFPFNGIREFLKAGSPSPVLAEKEQRPEAGSATGKETRRKFAGSELIAGKTYRVSRAFNDYDGLPHTVGEQWRYVAQNFVPYDDGLTLYIERDGQSRTIRLQWRPETQGDIISSFSDFVEEL